jgi:hypothetical protein
MDPNPFSNPPLGFILFGLVMVLLLAAAIYALGAWGAAKMRQGRIDDSTDIPYPERPHSADDRETVQQVQLREQTSDRVVSQEQLDDLAVGRDRKIVPQTPTRDERPIDAAERDKNARQVSPDSSDTDPTRDPKRSGGQDPL